LCAKTPGSPRFARGECKLLCFLHTYENPYLTSAYASIISDLGKHSETENHIAIGLGAMMLFAGHLATPEKMREFINGFN
ncbi:unnamed protein product, partial [marine sediment metagenome]